MTEDNTKPQQDTLDERDVVMMNFKLMGLKYKDIAAEMVKMGYEMTEDKMKELFRTNGRLFGVYGRYKTKRLEKLKDESLDLAKAHIKTAIECLVSVMAQREQQGSRVAAANTILERVIGKVPNINIEFDQGELDAEAEVIKKVIGESK